MSLVPNKNKLFKYNFMRSSVRLAPFLPETQSMTKDSLLNFMTKYRRIIAKPTGGMRGRGVFQVSAQANGRYEIHIENKKIELSGKEEVYDYLRNSIGFEDYIVQRWIPRATVDGRPFDIRVIVQRRKNSLVWVVTGKVAKVAGRGYIVSNIERSKGMVLPVNIALRRSSLKRMSRYILRSKLTKIAIKSAQRLSILFPGHRMYGLDMGIDRNGHVWIIEANLFPSQSHFRKLKDKTMLHRITAYKRG
jgi:glutathione synthase/RimK-type ligase-like ATP-grasp enzyme